MKTTELKKFIKEAIKEAIQEELKDILLEAVRTPKIPVGVGGYGTVTEHSTPQVNLSSKPEVTMDRRQAYMDVLGETALSFTSRDVAKFNPQGVDSINGSLPNGDVGMDQIMNLLGGK